MRVDLNADLGELPGTAGEAIDAALLCLITSANVAAGGHAGDDESMGRVCRIAQDRGVTIGAHLSFDDRPGFGRRTPHAFDDRLVDILRAQLDRLSSAAQEAGTAIAYVKPHGALYHHSLDDPECAAALIAAIGDDGLAVLTMRGSALEEAADAAGLATFGEFFADRGYLPNGRLIPRGAPGDLITQGVAERVVRAVTHGEVVAGDGTRIRVDFDSVCLHGDTPGAVAHAAGVRTALEQAGVSIASVHA